MNQAIFSQAEGQDEIRVRLYADEILEQKNSLGEKWMYMGIVAIPEAKHEKALAILSEARKVANYDREVHFVGLKNFSYARHHNHKTMLAKHWVEHFLNDDEKIFHFYMGGLNLTRLHRRSFGDAKDRDENMYNRFFRAAVSYLLQAFFGSASSVVVTHLFHDDGKLVHHKYFDWHTIRRLDRRIRNVRFECGNVTFINSDHQKEKTWSSESHFVQLCDVLMGGFSHCLDNRNAKDGCCEIAELLLPLAERLTKVNGYRSPNSRYRYANRVYLSFFPSRELTEEELANPIARAQSVYYTGRPLLYRDKLSGQLSLFG